MPIRPRLGHVRDTVVTDFVFYKEEKGQEDHRTVFCCCFLVSGGEWYRQGWLVGALSPVNHKWIISGLRETSIKEICLVERT